MAFMLVRSKVRDFNTWKPAYDAHQAVRSDAGLTEKYCSVVRMTPTKLSSSLKWRISIERERLRRPQTCVRGCKNLAWSTSQTSISSTGNGHLVAMLAALGTRPNVGVKIVRVQTPQCLLRASVLTPVADA